MVKTWCVCGSVVELDWRSAVAHGDKDGSLSCRDNWYSDRLVGQCEIREQKIPAAGMFTVDASRNGGVAIKGWDQNEVLVRARVQAAAATQSEADQLAKQIKIETAGAKFCSRTGKPQRLSVERKLRNLRTETF